MKPDDPQWLFVEPDIRSVDLQVLRQAGVPEPVLLLAVRPEGAGQATRRGPQSVGCRSYTDLSYLDELNEDPDSRPYTWDLPEDDIT